ncbi:hypothetical protein F4W66_24785 (plasmid) [Escherichia coli]|nr:hypothetical protein F4W66_24785 [Escherichia coli]
MSSPLLKWRRDLLLGKKPKDFDVTTNATPEQKEKCKPRNCWPRRGRCSVWLPSVMFAIRDYREAATFRGH